MTSLADDLLKSRTIPELRDLISTLEKDANGKKTELQQMVGSKYHDFIQSADKIAEMKTKSDLIERQIVNFWECNQDLILKAQDLLNQTLPEQHRKSKSSDQISLFSDLTSSSLWLKLNNCDVFEASKMITGASILSTKRFVSGGLNQSMLKYFSKDSQDLLSKLKFSRQQKSEFESVLSLTETVVDDSKLCLLDDDTTPSHTTLHAHTVILDKARALAALSVLTLNNTFGNEDSETERDLLGQYLEVANIRIQELFEGDLKVSVAGSDGRGKNGKTTNDSSSSASAPLDVDALSRGLTSLVTVLQEVVMDLYLLFLHSVEGRTGLVAHFQSDLIHSLIAQLTDHLQAITATSTDSGSSSGSVKTTSSNKEGVSPLSLTSPRAANNSSALLQFDFVTFLSDLNVNSAGAAAAADSKGVTVKDRVNVWLTNTLRIVTERCKVVLLSLTNASDVAMLQQRIWRVCTTITHPHHTHPIITLSTTQQTNNTINTNTTRERSNSINKSTVVVDHTPIDKNMTTPAVHVVDLSQYSYTQNIWELACFELLHVSSAKDLKNAALLKQKQRTLGSKSHDTNTAHNTNENKSKSTNILYSTVFRISFMHQVERLLSKSCADILTQTKSTIIQALAIEGVIIDVNTYGIKQTTITTNDTTNNTNKTNNNNNTKNNTNNDTIASHRLYNMAEYIRREFEHLVSTLYSNSNISPNTTNDDDDNNNSTGNNNTTSDILSDDPHAAVALTKTLKLHCSQLIGQVLIFMRSVVESCRDSLIHKGLLLSSSELNALLAGVKDTKESLISSELQTLLKHFTINHSAHVTTPKFSASLQTQRDKINNTTSITSSTTSSNTTSTSETPLLSSILLLGRLSWLFKTRGNFLENSLRPLPVTVKTAFVTVNNANNNSVEMTSPRGAIKSDGQQSQEGVILNSEDQFRSAFEIADTDGDGLLSYSEALEAIQALTMVDTSSSSPNNNNNTNNAYPGLSPHLTPHLTYHEFSLIAGGQLLSTSEQNPVQKLHYCLDYLIAFTHIIFAFSSVNKCCATFATDLISDLGINTSSNSVDKVEKEVENLFKISWISKCVDGNEDDQMLVPSVCSNSLNTLLYNVNKRVLAAVTSIDTMQTQIISPYNTNTNNDNNNINNNNNSFKHNNHHVSVEDTLELDVEVEDLETDTMEYNITSILQSSTFNTATNNNNNTQSVKVHTKTTTNMLSQIVTRMAYQLTFAFVYKSYTTVFTTLKSSVRPSLRGSGGPSMESILEDVSLQVVFDLSVLDSLASQYINTTNNTTKNTNTNTTPTANNSNNGSFRVKSITHTTPTVTTVYQALTSQFSTYLDPITAELIMPLLQEASAAYVQRMLLLFPAVFRGKALLRGGATLSSVTPGPSFSANKVHSSDVILSRIFPSSNIGSGVSNKVGNATQNTSIARFALLPLALVTVSTVTPAPVTSAVKSRNTTPTPTGTTPANTSSSTAGSGLNAAATTLKGVLSSASLAAGVGITKATAPASGSMKWW